MTEISLPGERISHVVQGDTAFVGLAEPNGLAAIDLSDPAHPQVRSVVSTGDWVPWRIAVSGGLTAVGTRSTGGQDALLLYELSQSWQLSLLSVLEVDGFPGAVEVRNQLVVLGSGPWIHLVDASDPQNPRIASSLEVCPSYPGCLDVAVIDNQAFVGMRYGDVRMAIVDLSDPEQASFDYLRVSPPSYWFATWLEARARTLLGGSSDWLFLAEVDGEGVPHFRDFRTTRSVSSGALTDTHVYLTSSPFLEAVTLECARPVAGFNWHQVGTHVWFDLQSGYGVTSTSWWYGDGLERHRGQPGPRSSHLHEYDSPGIYEVTLEVANEWGSNSVTKTVVVTRELGLSGGVQRPTGRVTP